MMHRRRRSSFFLLAFIAFCSSFRRLESRTTPLKIESLIQQDSSLSSTTSFDPSKVVQLSWHPRVFLYESFLSDDECDHLISLAHDKLEKIQFNTGNSTYSNSGMFISRGQDEIISKIEDWISTWTFLPKENGEELLILRYGTNESYLPRYDYLHDTNSHTVATIMIYLSNVTRGGETYFPRSEFKDTKSNDDLMSACATNGLGVKLKGTALLFFNLHPDATLDETSLNGGCKVLEGEKWTVTKWIHVTSFSPSKPDVVSDNEECTDEDPNCTNWAATGECQRNPVFMLGTADYYGSCRKSCGAC